MAKAICHEIALQKNYLPTSQLETIYFGGGTPSLLTDDELALIFQTIQQFYTIGSDAEITLEANPDDISTESLNIFKQYINRLSIGVQSFHEPHLRSMNRAHHAYEAESCVKLAQDAGFENITIDLMYGFPQDTSGDIWHKDLAKAISLNVPHISAYNLTIEPNTVLGKWHKKGKFPKVDEEQSAKEFEYMIAYLTQHGFEQYEISNFCKPLRYARHNTSYWQQKPYLGVGPSAHSFNKSSRQYNIANNALYIKSIENNEIPFDIEVLSVNEQVNDYILTSLRTKWGCQFDTIKKLVGIEKFNKISAQIKKFKEDGFLLVRDDTAYLSEKGKLFADRIASNLFLV